MQKMTTVHGFYEEKIVTYSEQIRSIQKRMNLISLLRLTAFSAFAITLFYLIRDFSYPALIGVIALFGTFIGLVNLAFRLKDRKSLLEKLLYINSNEQNVLNHELNGFSDGQDMLSSENYLDDLDIFGKRSLFHLLNRTATSHGLETLGNMLKQPVLSPEPILRYQEAVKVLADQADGRQNILANGLINQEEKGNLYSVVSWLETASLLLKKKWLLILRWLLPFFNVMGILFYLITDNYAPLFAGILISWIITGSFIKYSSQQHLLIGRKQAVLEQYASILRVFNSINPESSALLQKLQVNTGKAHLAIRQFSKLASFFDQRLNILVNIFLNSILLYDLQCMLSLEKWKEKNRALFPSWIEAVGQIECLNSLATFAFNNPGYHFPKPVQDKHLFIEATELAHPLIPSGERVPNDFTIGRNNQLILVTGSNMSGKTTFLRTVGVNLLLAQCGAPVCAEGFTFTPMHILSSLRVSDSLQEHTSYFMAELKKLQVIIHRLQSGGPALVLIDEILRGTNSEDKTHGSEMFIRK
ncbi:MutS-related protein, partial [Flavitalea flava]